jgi:hypothetical protein
MNGTAVYGEPVVIVNVEQGDVRLKTGRIKSDGSDHVQGDNRTRTVVWADKEFSSDPLDNAHEKEFNVREIHLLKADEVQALRDPATAQEWFGSIYQDYVVSKIQRALKRLKL